MCANVANSTLRFAAWAATGALGITNCDYGLQFYLEAKRYLKHTVNSDELTDTPSILAFQATVLTALYELRTAKFRKAGATIGHATWLAQVLQLHKLDSRPTTCTPFLLQQPPLWIPVNSRELDEARRAFWAILTLDCFLGIGIKWNVVNAIDYNEVRIRVCLLRSEKKNLILWLSVWAD